jgi:uncharacterized protein with von Willebrand factor type A (vWA) domain
MLKIDWSDGRFTAESTADGKSVRVKDAGRLVTDVSAEAWQSDGPAMIAAWKEGKAYDPSKPFAGKLLSPANAQEAKLELLENGSNLTREVDNWTRYLAAHEAREGGIFASSIKAVDAEQWPGVAREIFDSLYSEEPKLADPQSAGSEWIRELVNQAEGCPEWANLRAEVQGDPWAAGIAAGRVVTSLTEKAKQLLEALPKEDPQRLAEDAQAMQEVLGPKHRITKAAKKKAEEAEEQAAAALNLLTGGGDEEPAAGLLGAAANEARHEVAAITKGAVDLAGLATGALHSMQAAPETMRKLLAENPNLRKVAELAGRLRIRARAKQRTKTKYAPESIVDVTIGGELERLLPSEIMQAVMPETELLLLRKLQEREALQYELEGNEDLDRGPVIMAVDSSGSMAGIRNQWAMAVAISVLEIAAMQRRPFVLMHFDHEVKATFTVEKPANMGLQELVEMISYFSNGGTNFAPPLAQAHGIITNGKQKDGVFARADVMLITDGQASWGEWAQNVKATGAALYGVAIECRFRDDMEKELSGCATVGGAALHDATANVDLLFGI